MFLRKYFDVLTLISSLVLLGNACHCLLNKSVHGNCAWFIILVTLRWETVVSLRGVRLEIYQCYALHCTHILPHDRCLCLIFWQDTTNIMFRLISLTSRIARIPQCKKGTISKFSNWEKITIEKKNTECHGFVFLSNNHNQELVKLTAQIFSSYYCLILWNYMNFLYYNLICFSPSSIFKILI